jgi:large subunit ribosomal protein L30
MAGMLRIKLTGSAIGTKPQQRKTIKALGLKKINSVVEKKDNGAMRGMINTISHLVEFEEI